VAEEALGASGADEEVVVVDEIDELAPDESDESI
jgi:hypothetical protein